MTRRTLLSGLLTALAALLAACQNQPQPTPSSPALGAIGSSTLPAPAQIKLAPGSGSVRLSWAGVNDPNALGYLVYRDGALVNTDVIPASAGIRSQSGPIGKCRVSLSGALRAQASEYQFTDTGLTNAKVYRYSLTTVDADCKQSVLSDTFRIAPDVLGATRYLVRGADMGAQFQNVSVTLDGAAVSSAEASVNGTPIPFVAGSSLYQGSLSAPIAVGNAIKLRAVVPEGEITAFDTVPEAPAVTAPASGATLDASSPQTVTWTSATNPDRFRVALTWSCGAGCGTGSSFDAAGGDRSLSLPANTLPADTGVKVRIYAVNDGTETFVGPFALGSRMSLRNGDEAGRDIKTTKGGGQSVRKIAIVYDIETSAALLYKAELEPRGFVVDLVPVASITSGAVLDPYAAFLIDPYSGSLESWAGSSAVVSLIRNSGKPAIGLGEGGYAYLGKLGSMLGYPHGWHGGGELGFDVIPPSHASLLGPRLVSTAGGRVAVSSAPMRGVSIYVPAPVAGLVEIGREEGEQQHDLVLAYPGKKEALWGFQGQPTAYTSHGWNALANLIDFMIALP